jgi:phosphoglycolate phosphatase
MALEGSGIEPGPDVWFLGDSITDLECAYNTGCIPVFYGDQDLEEERFANHQPHLHVKDHQELLEVLQKLDV